MSTARSRSRSPYRGGAERSGDRSGGDRGAAGSDSRRRSRSRSPELDKYKVEISGLGHGVKMRDLEDIFDRYGKIRSCYFVSAQTAFGKAQYTVCMLLEWTCFEIGPVVVYVHADASLFLRCIAPCVTVAVEYYDDRDADDAIYKEDGRSIDGYRVRVQLARRRGLNSRREGGGGGGRYDSGASRNDSGSRYGGGPPGGFRGGSSSRPPPRCYECNELGHFGRDCKNPSLK